MLVFVRSFVDANEFFSLLCQLLEDLVAIQELKLSIFQLCAKKGLLGEIHGLFYLNLVVFGLRNVHFFLLLFLNCADFLGTVLNQVFQTLNGTDLFCLRLQDLIDGSNLR